MSARETFRNAVQLAELDDLVPIVDKALGYPRPGWTPAGERLPDGVGVTEHYSLPQPNHDRSQYCLLLPELDPDDLPAALDAKLSAGEKGLLVAALRSRAAKPADWAGPAAAEVIPDLERGPKP